MKQASAVVWHDIECGAYRQDMEVWFTLAAQRGGTILDVGAGTGRVSLELARAGRTVVALDRDPELLAELERRAAGVPLQTVEADARTFELGERFPLIVMPMQTIQLLGGAAGRAAFLGRAGRHLAPGGLLAVSIAEAFEEFSVEADGAGPLPDVEERDGFVYFSQPTAVRRDGGRFWLERRRETVDPAGVRVVSHDAIALDLIDADGLEDEGRAVGLRPLGVIEIAATDEHIGSRVVTFGA